MALSRGEALKGCGGQGWGGRARWPDPPEDKVPVLKPETDEVLATASLSHVLPGKHRIAGVPGLDSRGPSRCGLHPPRSHRPGHQEAGDPKAGLDALTHHALPEQEAVGRAGPNLQLDGLRHLGQAAREGLKVADSFSPPRTHQLPHHPSHLLEKMWPGRARKPSSWK